MRVCIIRYLHQLHSLSTTYSIPSKIAFYLHPVQNVYKEDFYSLKNHAASKQIHTLQGSHPKRDKLLPNHVSKNSQTTREKCTVITPHPSSIENNLCNRTLPYSHQCSLFSTRHCQRLMHLSSRISKKSDQWLPTDPYDNPLDGLTPLVEVPLIEEVDYVFKPSFDDIYAAQACFDIHKGEMLVPYRGVIDPAALNDGGKVPEVDQKHIFHNS